MSKTTDIWMPIVIGDYLKDTQHLDATRHGCYLLWLMHYWIKGPLPNSIDELILIGKLRGTDAPSIAQILLQQFFSLGADGMYHQKRADSEKLKWKGKQQKAHDKAADAARSRWKLNAPSIPTSNTQAMLDPMLGSCPSPSPKNLELTLLSPEATQIKIRPEEFANTWNRLRGKLPKVEDFSESRKKKILTRMKQGLTLERFEQAVKLCTEKPFLRGEGRDHWRATFDWLVANDRNISRVFEEKWDAFGSPPEQPKLQILSRPRGGN